MSAIHDLIEMIPEHPQDEALLAIESITTFPAKNTLRIRCHLSSEFTLYVQVGEQIVLSAEDRNPVACGKENFLSQLRRFIHTLDEAIADGSYRQTPAKPNYITMPTPPKGMDIPVWDEAAGKWYDAEY